MNTNLNTTHAAFLAANPDPIVFALHLDGQAQALAYSLGRDWLAMGSVERNAYREAVEAGITADPAENTMPNGYATAATMTDEPRPSMNPRFVRRVQTTGTRTFNTQRKLSGPDPLGIWAARKVFV